MQASLGAQPGTGLTALSVPVTIQEQWIRPRLGNPTTTSLVPPRGVVAPPPPPPGFPARLPPLPLVATASMSRAPVTMPAPSPLSRLVTQNVPTDTLRARYPPFPMAMGSGATVSSAGPSPPPAMTGPFGPPQAARFVSATVSPHSTVALPVSFSGGGERGRKRKLSQPDVTLSSSVVWCGF